MSAGGVGVGGVVARYGGEFLAGHGVTPQQLKVLRHVSGCRTAALGGHAEVCPECGEVTYHYNSCRDRHCPRCQSYARERWVAERSRDLLDCGYWHAVFTVPSELHAIFVRNQALCYGLLFRCAWSTVDSFARDRRWLGARTGATAVLHTWGRQLQYHPHVHMIVPGGGLDRLGRWRPGPGRFFAPVRAMSEVFRGRLLDALAASRDELAPAGGAGPADLDGLLSSLRSRPWVVYFKRPFSDAASVLAYLGRYTHRVAICDSRIVSCEGGRVRFRYRDSRDHDREKVCDLDACEFIRRFLTHVLPKGFCKVRHYGILACRGKNARIDGIKRQLRQAVTDRVAVDPVAIVTRMLGHAPGTCPTCGCALRARPLLC